MARGSCSCVQVSRETETLFSRGEGRALFRKQSLLAISPANFSRQRARGAFCAAALNPEMLGVAVRYYGVQVRCPLPQRTVRRCCCPPCYIKRYSTALCFAFMHTRDTERRGGGGRRGDFPLATTLCHSLFSSPPLSSFGRILRSDGFVCRSCLSLFKPFHLFLSRTCASFCLFSRKFRPFSLPPLFRPCGSDA